MYKSMCRIQFLALLWVLTGCSSFHLYDKGADERASNAKKNYEETKVTDTIKTVRSNLEVFEKREVDAFVKVVTVNRDIELLSLLNESKTPFIVRFKEKIKNRLDVLASGWENSNDIKYPEEQTNLLSLMDKEKEARNTFLERADILQYTTPDKLLKCEPENEGIFKKTTPDSLRKALANDKYRPHDDVFEKLLDQYKTYGKVCSSLLDERKKVVDAKEKPSDDLSKAARDVDERAMALDNNARAVEAAATVLKDAIDKIASVQQSKESAANSPSLVCQKDSDQKLNLVEQNPQLETNDICLALANLNKLGDLGLKVISEEQIKSIDQIVTALSGSSTEEDQKELPPALALLSTSVRFAGSIKQYQSTKILPALEPLLIEKQLASTRLSYATQGHELKKFQLILANEKFAALRSEFKHLIKAWSYLSGIKPVKNCETKRGDAYCLSASLLMEEKRLQATIDGEPPGRMVFRALASFAESVSVGKARYASADLKLTLSEYRDSLNRSEAAVASWDALIATPLSQIQTYHASGLTSDDLAKFIQALSLVAIAVGIW